METTIKVSHETKKKINFLKYELDAKNHDETIRKLLEIVQKVEEVKQ